tara:strand:- start:1976 stop:2239 length:264 start_codon:yes stop_codon:yes gene_type:complete
MYSYKIRSKLEKSLQKLSKKNPKQSRIIKHKVQEICINPHRYKNLRKPLQNLKRVHIDKSFVLLFSIDDKQKLVIIEDLDHHDNIYN